MPAPPLRDVVVLEQAGRLAAAAGAGLLAELGATVIRVEPASSLPGTEPVSWQAHPLALAGKLRVRLSADPATAERQWRALAEHTDVIIRSEGYGSSLETPHGKIVCTVSSFDGDAPNGLPEDCSEAIIQAMTGLMGTTGEASGAPEVIGAPLVELFTALNCVTAVLAALRVRETGGPAQTVSVSTFDAGVALLGAYAGHIATGTARDLRAGARHPLCCPWNAYPTADGWVLICSSTDRQWQRIAELVGRGDMANDPRFETMADRMRQRELIDATVAAWTTPRTTQAVIAAFDAAGVPVGPIARVADLLAAEDGPPTREVGLPDGGKWRCPAGLFPLEGCAAPSQVREMVDEIEVILRQLPNQEATSTAATAPAKPLHGVRVIEVGAFTAGPLGTRYMADLGAEVIKIEPEGGEIGRRWQPGFGGVSGYFSTYNAGKRSITLDLQSDAGRSTLAALLESADVLLENLKAGALARLGFAPEAMLTRYPKLIYCSVSGYGAGGPQSPALDTVIQARSGLMSLIASRAAPIKAGPSVADLLAAHISPPAVLAALRRRDKTGQGANIDIGMRDALAWTTQLNWPSGEPSLPTYRRIACRDGWLVAEAPESEVAAALQGVEPESSERDTLLRLLRKAGLRAAPVLEPDEIRHLPIVRNRHLFAEADTPGGTPAPVIAAPFRMTETPVATGASVATPGEDNTLLAPASS